MWAGVAAYDGGAVGSAGEPVEANGEVTQGGHNGGAGSGADLVVVLGEDDRSGDRPNWAATTGQRQARQSLRGSCCHSTSHDHQRRRARAGLYTITGVAPATPKPTTCRAPAAAVLEPDSETGVLAARCKGETRGRRTVSE